MSSNEEKSRRNSAAHQWGAHRNGAPLAHVVFYFSPLSVGPRETEGSDKNQRAVISESERIVSVGRPDENIETQKRRPQFPLGAIQSALVPIINA
jgi:hypothetical protein